MFKLIEVNENKKIREPMARFGSKWAFDCCQPTGQVRMNG
jgi:hypothetical protein